MSQAPRTFRPYSTSTPGVANTVPYDQPPTGVSQPGPRGAYVIKAKVNADGSLGFDYFLNGQAITNAQWDLSGLNRSTYEDYAANNLMSGQTAMAGEEPPPTDGGGEPAPLPPWNPETALTNYNTQKSTLQKLFNEGIINYENYISNLGDVKQKTIEAISGRFSGLSPQVYQSAEATKYGQTQNVYDVGQKQGQQQLSNYQGVITNRQGQADTAYGATPEYFDPAYGNYTDYSAGVPDWQSAMPQNPEDIMNQFNELQGIKSAYKAASAPAIAGNPALTQSQVSGAPAIANYLYNPNPLDALLAKKSAF